jgi:RES domain-containing protein
MLLKRCVLCEVVIDPSCVRELALSSLPKNWKASLAPAKLRTFGCDWIAGGSSVVLRVPSTLVPGEANFLLNPRHPGFTQLEFGKPLPFQFDPRFARSDRG